MILLFLAAGCGGAKRAAEGLTAEAGAGQPGYGDFGPAYSGSGYNPDIPAGAEVAGTAADNADQAREASVFLNEKTFPGDAAKTRKLVKRAEIAIEADQSFVGGGGELAGVNQKLDELLKKYGAYSERTFSGETSIHCTIRVPQGFYESLLSETAVLGKLRSRNETAEDVTLKYYDLEGRLNTRKALLATFQGYLSRTQNIDDIMKVETRIADLQNEIDWLGTQLTQLAGLVDYAVIELSLYSPRHSSSHTLRDRIGDLFAAFGDFASGGLVIILGIIIFGLPLILLCLVAFWLFFGRIGLLKKACRVALYGRPDPSSLTKQNPLPIHKKRETE
ncbi:MAG: DUF4349 domain-containing protein [Treponema sp.]|nr:DUF4349 domain-containing protein [Treponema sp.]